MLERILAVIGMFVMLGISLLLSEDRKRVDWGLVFKGTMLQLVFAFLMLRTTVGQVAFSHLDNVIMKALHCANAGAVFVFSKVLADPDTAGKLFGSEATFIFAFQALPVIIFMSALVAILYHIGIMQKIVLVIAIAMKKTLKISGAEACSAAANIFVGQTEAPLLVKPYIATMTRSELFSVMVGGLATISGSTLASYVAMLKDNIPGIAGHMVAASVMSAPAAVVFAKIMFPETDTPKTLGSFTLPNTALDTNVIDACSRGCTEGLHLALNVAAMLVGFLSVIALVDLLWAGIANCFGWTACNSVQALCGWVFSPFALLLGVPFEDMRFAGTLLGEKTILNEFVAYFHFATELAKPDLVIAMRTRVIISYALCGFANIGSIGTLIAGVGGMAPSRRGEISRLALKSLVAGTFASFATAIIAGLIV